MLAYQKQSSNFHTDFNYIYWRFILDSGIKSRHRVEIFKDFRKAYRKDGKKDHPRVMSLIENIINQNTLTPKDTIEKVLKACVDYKDIQRKRRFFELCELFLEKNNYEKNLINSIFDYKNFYQDALDRKDFHLFQLRILSHRVQNSKESFLNRYFCFCWELMPLERKNLFSEETIPLEDISEICETETFEWVKKNYTYEEVAHKLNVLFFPNTFSDSSKFVLAAVNKLYNAQNLDLFTKNHLRQCLGYIGIPFVSHYHKEVEKRRKEQTFLDYLPQLPQSKIAFDKLMRDIKSSPKDLEELLNHQHIKDGTFEKKILKYIQSLDS